MLKIGYNGEQYEALDSFITDELSGHGFSFREAKAEGTIIWLSFNGFDAQEFVNREGDTLGQIVGQPLQFVCDTTPEQAVTARPPQPTPQAIEPSKQMMFFGWCNIGTSDKIWGVIKAQREWITFWGGRTKKLSFKKSSEYAGGDTLTKLIRSKEKKGYSNTTMVAMNALDSTFEVRFEEELVFCLLADTFHGH